MAKRAHGEGTIYQRKSDGIWCGQLTLPSGKRRSYYGKTQKIVRDRLSDAKRDLEQGITPAAARSEKLSVYLAEWLEVAVQPRRKPSTYASYELNVRRLSERIGKVPLGSLTPEQIQHACTELQGSGLSARSVAQARTVLHGALKHAMKRGLIPRNPCDLTVAPRTEHREMQTLTSDQLEMLFTATRGEPLHALWCVLGTTGIREGEALGLKWSDLDSAANRIIIRRSLQRQRGLGLVFTDPKTRTSRRAVSLLPVAVAALGAHRSRQAKDRLQAGPEWQESGLVFASRLGKPLDSSRITEQFRAALAKAGLPRMRVHDLRHTAATIALENGVNPKMVQEMLGHSSITTTMNTYGHVTPAMHADMAAKLSHLYRSDAASASPA